MRNVFKIILIACVIIALIRCEKEEQNELVNIPYRLDAYSPDDLKSFLVKEGYQGIKTRSNERIDYANWRSADPCNEPVLSAQPYGSESIFTRPIRDGVCGYRIGTQDTEDDFIDVLQSFKSDSTFWNCFYAGLYECADEIGTIYLVPEGEGNFSPAQYKIVGKYSFYPHQYADFAAPIFTLQARRTDYALYIIENLDHSLNGIGYFEGFCLADYLPIIEALPIDAFEVGDLVELYNDI